MVRLCVSVLNASQRSERTVEHALRLLRLLSPIGGAASPRDSRAERMAQTLLESGAVPSVLMALATYPQSVAICAHGIRTIQWVMEVTSPALIRVLLDEQVLLACLNLLARHSDARLLQYLCGVLAKFCGYLGRRVADCSVGVDARIAAQLRERAALDAVLRLLKRCDGEAERERGGEGRTVSEGRIMSEGRTVSEGQSKKLSEGQNEGQSLAVSRGQSEGQTVSRGQNERESEGEAVARAGLTVLCVLASLRSVAAAR